MASEWAEAELAAIREQFANRMKRIAELQRKRAQLTASSSVLHGRITVTVNAEGTVIDTRFTSNIGDLNYSEIARGMTQAAQAASAEVARKSRELAEPLRAGRSGLPAHSELVAGLEEFEAQIPQPPPVPTTPPSVPERPTEQSMEFADAADYEQIRRRARGPGIIDRGR